MDQIGPIPQNCIIWIQVLHCPQQQRKVHNKHTTPNRRAMPPPPSSHPSRTPLPLPSPFPSQTDQDLQIHPPDAITNSTPWGQCVPGRLLPRGPLPPSHQFHDPVKSGDETALVLSRVKTLQPQKPKLKHANRHERTLRKHTPCFHTTFECDCEGSKGWAKNSTFEALYENS